MPVAAGEVGYLGNTQVHAQVVLLLSVSISTLRTDLWCIRGTIHLESDDSWINPRPSQPIGRTRRYCSAARRLGYRPRAMEATVKDRTALTELAWIYVCLRRNADALRIAKAATESMPIE